VQYFGLSCEIAFVSGNFDYILFRIQSKPTQITGRRPPGLLNHTTRVREELAEMGTVTSRLQLYYSPHWLIAGWEILI
jgi:hypothetical protein